MLPYSFKIDNLCSYLFVSSIQQIMQEKAKGVVQLDTFTKISEISGFWDSIDTRELEFQFFVNVRILSGGARSYEQWFLS